MALKLLGLVITDKSSLPSAEKKPPECAAADGEWGASKPDKLAENARADDREENRRADAQTFKSEGKAEAEKEGKHFTSKKSADAVQGDALINKNAREFQSYDGKKRSDTECQAGFHPMRDRVNDPLPDTGRGEDHKNYTGPKNGTHRLLPRKAKGSDDEECDVGVHLHAWCHRKW